MHKLRNIRCLIFNAHLKDTHVNDEELEHSQ